LVESLGQRGGGSGEGGNGNGSGGTGNGGNTNDWRATHADAIDRFNADVGRANSVNPDLGNASDGTEFSRAVQTTNRNIEIGEAMVSETYRQNWSSAQLADLGRYAQNAMRATAPLAILDAANTASDVAQHLRNGDYSAAGTRMAQFFVEEAGATAGALAGARLGAFLGPKGAIAGALIGGVLGGMGAGQAFADPIGTLGALGGLFGDPANGPGGPGNGPGGPGDPGNPGGPGGPGGPGNGPGGPGNGPGSGPGGWPPLFPSPPRDPLVLDLDGDGIELVALAASQAHFDFGGDGFAERTGWVAADDGLLVWDRDGSNAIDAPDELFGNDSQHGFQVLAALDSNSDGRIDAADSDFVNLRIWRDLDGDGATDAGELTTLSAASVAAINLSHSFSGQRIAGNVVEYTGTYMTSAGAARDAGAVFFATNQTLSVWQPPSGFQVHSEAAQLPELKGYGQLTNLSYAMTMDVDLRALVGAYVDTLEIRSPGGIQGGLQEILFRWANVDAVVPDARGTAIDARKVTFLEKFFGTAIEQPGATGPSSVIGSTYAATLERSFTQISEGLLLRFVASVPESYTQRGMLGGSLLESQYFWLSGLGFDAEQDVFAAPITPILEAVFRDMPTGNIETATDYVERMSVVLRGAADAFFGGDRTAYAAAVTVAAADIDDAALRALVTRLATDNVLVTGIEDGGTLLGSNASEVIRSLPGYDTILGSGGRDTYVHVAGSGHDVIDEQSTSTNSHEDWLLLPSVVSSMVVLARGGSNSTDLVISISENTESITITNYFKKDFLGQYASRIEEIYFADGTTWTYSDVFAQLTAGTESADVLIGDEFDNAFSGMGGSDLLAGDNGADDLSGGEDNDTLDGGEGNDSLAGGEGADSLQGGMSFANDGGADTLDGGAGNDTLAGGGGNDVYFFGRGAGVDRVVEPGSPAAGGADAILVGADVAHSELLLARSGSGSNDLVLSISGASDRLTVASYFATDSAGGSGYRVEEIRFANGTVWTYADIVARLSAATEGADTILGDNGINALSGLGGADSLVGRGGADWLEGGDGNDTLDGGEGNDSLAGGDGADSLQGGTSFTNDGGADTLDGGAGADTLSGGGGDDVYLFGWGYGAEVVVETGGTADILVLSADIAAADVTLARAGTNLDDLVLTIAGSTDSVTVRGHFGKDVLGSYSAKRVEEIRFADGTVWTYDDTLARVTAPTAGADTLYGDDFANALGGLDGADRLFGRLGADTLTGGLGADTLDGGEGNDTLDGGEGNDSLQGGMSFVNDGGADTLDGGAGNDTLAGGGGSDNYLFGIGSGQEVVVETGGAADVLRIGAGIVSADVMLVRGGTNLDDLVLTVTGLADRVTVAGHFGKDTSGSHAAKRVEEIRFADGTVWTYDDTLARVTAPTAGADTIHGDDFDNSLAGGDGNDRLSGRLGADTLTGGTGADTLDGGEGNDTLLGGDGADSLHGGSSVINNAGADTLDGGAGADTLTGGGAGDIFRFSAIGDSTLTSRDTVTDFSASAGDLIDLSALDADTATAGDQAFAWLGVGAAFGGVAGQLRGRTVGSDLEVLGDVDGDTVADFALLLRSTATLSASAFVL